MATLQRLSRLQTVIFRHSVKCRCQNQFVRHASSGDSSKKLVAADDQKYILDSEEFEVLRKHFGNDDPKAMKNWVPRGWSLTDRDLDSWHHNMSLFSAYTLVLCLGAFLYWFMPDYMLRDWVQREAYLDLDRREQKGLPAIDPYFVAPEKMSLPKEQDIDQEIIV